MISRPAKTSPANKTLAIVDTGYLVAFARREDEYHQWALALAGRLQLPLLTCEAVLAETSFMLQSSAYVLDLAVRYADRKPDLADLCLIRMSELYPEHRIVTVDADFRIYRRNKGESIPLICPSKQ